MCVGCIMEDWYTNQVIVLLVRIPDNLSIGQTDVPVPGACELTHQRCGGGARRRLCV